MYIVLFQVSLPGDNLAQGAKLIMPSRGIRSVILGAEENKFELVSLEDNDRLDEIIIE